MNRAICQNRLCILGLLLLSAACGATADKRYVDRPDSDRVGALNGLRECGFLVGEHQVGHWIRYQIKDNVVIVDRDDYYDESGRLSGPQNLIEAGQLSAVSAYDANVENGFRRLVDNGGVLRRICYVANGRIQGWELDFQNGLKRFYEDGVEVVRVPITSVVDDMAAMMLR